MMLMLLCHFAAACHDTPLLTPLSAAACSLYFSPLPLYATMVFHTRLF